MSLVRTVITAALALLISNAAMAEDAVVQAMDNILKRLHQARPDLSFTDVRPSQLPGFYEVSIKQGPKIYVTEDGGHFFAGDLFAVREGQFVNLAELQRQESRREMIAAVAEKDMIVFAPEEETKGTVTIFTDVDCFYCQKLHLEVPKLNDMGIKVRYLAYPRAGPNSESFRRIASAWCNEDPQDAITRLKAKQTIPMNVCSANPVMKQFMLGQQVGVSGTPALVLEDGSLLPGYMPAEQLVERIGAI